MYLLFAWKEYEESGGMRDLKGTFNTLDEAIAAFSPEIVELYGHPYSSDRAEIWENRKSELVCIASWGDWKREGDRSVIALEWRYEA